jgi:hypothetical protein
MDNYTQIPNCLFNLLPYLTAAELKIILHIIRKTIGFHKETDRISYSLHYPLTYWTELRISMLENEHCSLTAFLL